MGAFVSKVCCQQESTEPELLQIKQTKNIEYDIDILEQNPTEINFLEKLEFSSFLDVDESRKMHLKKKERACFNSKDHTFKNGAIAS